MTFHLLLVFSPAQNFLADIFQRVYGCSSIFCIYGMKQNKSLFPSLLYKITIYTMQNIHYLALFYVLHFVSSHKCNTEQI